MLDLSNPFPGLRCFLSEEDYLFFGRHEQIEDLLRRLRTNRLVAVVGTSGSGKSSLVRAGLLPAVLGGGMAQAGSAWEIAVMRPGGSPMAHLARTLCEAGLYDADAEDALFHLQATLSRSRNGLLEAVRQSRTAAGSKLLLVVDQFEELFRFNRASATSQEEAIGFVNLLLHATQQADQNVYVVLTMRSDFLGECSQFLGLAEAVNDGEFLIPRMTRDQIQEAVEGPIRVRGAEIAPRLLFRLLNDVEDNQDQLPVLQHALMRTWDLWQHGQPPVSAGGHTAALDLEHYEATGGMHESLSRHADEIFAAFPSDAHRTAAARLFKALTERGPDGRGIRRPIRLDELVAIAAVEKPIVHQVIEAYRAPGVTFLMPPVTSALDDTAVIDISHESLMRVWSRLRGWVEEEAQSARIYHRLQESAVLHGEKRADLYHDPDLQIALSWREASQPNPAWAGQYGGEFDEAMAFLDLSQQASVAEEQAREVARQRELEQARELAEAQQLRLEQQQRSARRLRAMLAGFAVVAAIAVATSIVAGQFWQAANVARLDAEQSAELARKNAALAKTNADFAKQNEATALKEAQRADHEAEVAQRNLFHAQMHLAQQTWREPLGLPPMRGLLKNWLPEGESPDRRGWEWFYLNSLPYQNLRTLTESKSGGNGYRPCIVAWHAATKRLAAGDADGLIRIWDVDREQTILTLRGPAPIHAWCGTTWFAWSPDGAKLAAGCNDGSLHVWDTSSARKLSVFRGNSSPVLSVAYSSDGMRVATWGKNGKIKIWDADTGRLTADVSHPGEVFSGAWSPDDKLLASGHSDGTVTISGTHPGDKIVTLRGHASTILRLAWRPDGARIVSTSDDFTSKIWEVVSEKMVLGPLRHSHSVTSVAWEPGGQRLATGSADQSVKIWNATTGHEDLTLRGHSGKNVSVSGLDWGPDGRLASAGTDYSVRIWNSIHDQESSILPGHVVGASSVRASSVSWSPDGKRLASGGDDGKIRIWDPATRAEVLSIKGHDERRVNGQFGLIRSLAWNLDGTNLASAGVDGTAKIWEVATGREVFALPADRGSVWSVAWSPDGTHLAAGSQDGTIRVVELLKDPPKVHVFKAHEPRTFGTAGAHGVRTLAWSSRGDRLASGGLDKLVRVWDPIRGTELARLQGHQHSWITGVAWSPDGKRLVSTGADGLVIVWDAETGQKLSTMRGHNTWVDAVVWSPDGTRLASAGLDNTVRVSDPRTGEETFVLRGNAGFFHDVSWHPDGAQLAAASSDGRIWIWDATRGFERDTTPRALPFIDRKVASGTACGEDRRWYAESYIRAGKLKEALALVKNDRDSFRSLFAKLPADEQEVFAQLWADAAKVAEPANNAERIELAQIAFDLKQFTFATRLWAEALESDPKLGDDRQKLHRDNAARAAALAAAEQGQDEPPLDDAAKAKHRGQALDWLKAELTVWGKLLESGPRQDRPAIVQTLIHWQNDHDLAGIRDAGALAKLRAEERAACAKLWAEVTLLLKAHADVDLLAAKSNLAAEYLRAGKQDQALPLLVEILNDRKARLGPDHSDTLETMNQLGVVYWQVRQLDKSVPLFEELLKSLEAKLGRDHLQTVHAAANLGVNYKDAGRLKDAIPLLEEAHRAAKQDLNLGWVINPLIDAYSRAGENAKLANLLKGRLPEVRKALPKDSPELAQQLASLGLSLLQAKAFAEAEPLIRECLAIRAKTLPDGWSTFNTKSMLGGALLGQKKYAEAEPLLLAGYEGMKQREKTIPEQGKVRIPEAIERLVQLYEATDKKDEATKWRKELEASKSPDKKQEKQL